jgi:hypothetical protein
MVGIITHIPELRDEFAQQVIVTKRQGYSTVEVRDASERYASERYASEKYLKETA